MSVSEYFEISKLSKFKRRRKLTVVKEKIPSGHGCREVLSNFDDELESVQH